MTKPEVSRPELDPRETVPTFRNDVTLLGATRAVVSQIWVYGHDSKESHHVLSEVDLVQNEVPRVDASRGWRDRLRRKSRWSVHAESSVISAAQALQWYDSLIRTGRWSPLWRKEPLTAPVDLTEILEEPRWPSLVMQHESRAVPLASRRAGTTRMHHVLCEGAALQDLLPEKEFLGLLKLVREHHGLDLSQIPELLQSAHFFQPLPLLRYVGTRLDSDPDGNDSSILVDVVPRHRAKLDGLEIHILEQRSTGERMLARFRPSGVLYRLPLSEEVGQIRTRVIHDDLGLILDEGPYAFLKGITTTFKLQTRERRVSLPERNGRPARTIRIPVSGSEPMVVSQGTESRSASQVLHAINSRLTTAAVAKDSERWFLGDPATAERALREILGRAEQRALIVDSYFTASELSEWLPSVATVPAKIQVLTSAAGLRAAPMDEGSAKGNQKESKQLKLLGDALKEERSTGQINDTEVRVMIGKQSPIHDRFLVADQRVWLMGSSLNSFGSHGTMLVELRRPSEVLAELVKAWNEAPTVEQRRAQLKAEGANGESSL